MALHIYFLAWAMETLLEPLVGPDGGDTAKDWRAQQRH